MRKLDLIDRKILFELDTNARGSFSSIAKKLKIGKNNVQYRIKRLVEDKVIKKFVTQISLAKLGLFLGKIYLQMKGFDSDTEKAMYNYLIDDKRISWIAKCEGRWDLMLGSYVDSLSQFNQIKRDFFIKYEQYITSYDIVFLTEGYNSQRTYLLNKKTVIPKKIRHFMGKGIKELSDDDKKILKLLSNDARISYVELAKKMGMNVKTIQKKIYEFEKEKIIQGFVTFLDPEVIGFTFFKSCIYLSSHKNYEQILSFCLDLSNVIHVIESLGPWEIEIEIETENIIDFYEITHTMRNRFPDIKKTESVMISKELKLDFFPAWF